jgi:dienelactone hydrolase
MRIFTRLLTLVLVCMSYASNAQTRYVDDVFSEVNVTAPTPVASNYTILQWIASQGQLPVIRQPLVAQFYSPKGDTETNRPLVIYIHTGNFFPFPANGSCGGTLADSSNVEIAMRLAKKGYVVAMVNYRQGWNPFDNNELIRRYFLINAAYRGVQDMSTYVRYFRRSVKEFGNPHGIDAEKITMWGQGTGGYLSLAAAYLNQYSEIVAAPGGKFILPLPTGGTVPMVIEAYNGNIDATGPITTVDATYNSLSQLRIGDTLCIPNHVADPAGNPYSSDFALAVNMGGALGDSSWVNTGEIPLISYHVTTDPFAPCGTDILNVPTPTGPKAVVEVSGSCEIAKIIERKGLNNVFKTIPSVVDPASATNISGYPGFYEFRSTPNNTSSPWEWAASATTAGGATGCNTDGISARKYIDTIMAYFTPRACFALNLPCKDKLINTKDLTDVDVQLMIAPNPASLDVTITTADNAPMKAVTVYDITGRVLAKNVNIDQSRFVVERNNLNNGLYFVKIDFDKGSLTKKIIFE